MGDRSWARAGSILGIAVLCLLRASPTVAQSLCMPGPMYVSCMQQQQRLREEQQEQRQQQLREERQRAQQIQQQQQQQQRPIEQRPVIQHPVESRPVYQQPVQRPVYRPVQRPVQPLRPVMLQPVPTPGRIYRAPTRRQYSYHGRSFSPVVVRPYRFPRGYHYRRWHVGERLLRALILDEYILTDWSDYGLDAPPGDDEWVRYGDDLIEVDPDTDEIDDAIYGFFTTSAGGVAALPEAEAPAAPAGMPNVPDAPGPFLAVAAVASNHDQWVFTDGATLHAALRNALAACAQDYPGQACEITRWKPGHMWHHTPDPAPLDN